MKIQICMGSKCILMGAMNIHDQIEDLIERINEDPNYELTEEITIEPVKCLNYCEENQSNVAPIVLVNDEVFLEATGQQIVEKILAVTNK